MVKKAEMTAGKARNGARKRNQQQRRRGKILSTIAELNQIQSESAISAQAVELFKSWLGDESGYDERVWPRLKKALERERQRAGARRLYGA